MVDGLTDDVSKGFSDDVISFFSFLQVEGQLYFRRIDARDFTSFANNSKHVQYPLFSDSSRRSVRAEGLSRISLASTMSSVTRVTGPSGRGFGSHQGLQNVILCGAARKRNNLFLVFSK